MKTRILLMFLLLLLVESSCNKDENNDLTPETQTGANTFSCKINGQNFIARQSLFGPKPIFVSNTRGAEPSFLLDGRNTEKMPYKEIEIKVFEDIKPGTYQLGGDQENYGSIEYRYPDDLYKTDINNPGSITFTRIDNVNKIYSGSFSFSCVNSNNQQIQITSGRFDTKIGN